MMRTERPHAKSYADTLRDIVGDRAPLKFNPKDTVPDIISRMRAGGVGAGGVIDSAGAFIGLVTEREVARRIFDRFDKADRKLESLYEHKAVSQMTAWYVMICNPETLYVDDAVEDALDLITYLGYRYMPVMGKGGKFLGIVGAQELRRHVEEKSKVMKIYDDPVPPHLMQQELQSLNISSLETY